MPTERILVVDLDGTLLRSDILHESFWSSFASSWRNILPAIAFLGTQGRAALKKELARTCSVDVSLLPYNAEVIAYVDRWRAVGGRTALVTASDQSLRRLGRSERP